ncbi:MAG: hypothetical protein GY757_02895 [bacterium]|nr:hypothetical protein [bacterium]
MKQLNSRNMSSGFALLAANSVKSSSLCRIKGTRTLGPLAMRMMVSQPQQILAYGGGVAVVAAKKAVFY